MADSLIQAELLAACSGLGYFDGVKYFLEADCLETVKDLIRYLRRDDDSHQIRRALGETKVLQTDLIPIIKFHSVDKELFDVTLRLLVNLTNPVLLLFKEELPEEKITRQQYLQMIGHQQSFKEAFANEAVWSVLVGRLGEILNKDLEEREEEERLVVERILILTRNVLAVASSPDEEKRTDGDASVHDQVLWALHLARFEDLILYISSSNSEQELCMHVIEIISFMLKEQNSSELGIAGLKRSQTEKEKDKKELLEMRRREAYTKQQKIKHNSSSRHSRFGGTYYVMNMKSISENNMIVHKHVVDLESLSFDQSKRSKKIPKNRAPLQDVEITRRSPLAIRMFLQEFCIEFLNGAFNSLMYIVKDNLNRAKAQEHDEIYYLWAVKFFLEFNRVHNFKVELITEILNVHTFHYIQTQMEHYYETMTTDKKKIPLWSRRMHKGLKAYQELLMTLSFMDMSDNGDIRESSKILKNKVFYVVEYRELVLILLQNFDEVKMTKSYLRDLIETTHIFLKLLEGLCGKQRHMVVQKKKKKKRPKKKPVNKPAQAPPTEEELVMKWDEISDNLLSVINGGNGELPQTFPYDPVSDIPEDEQKEIAMRRINGLLRNGELIESVSLLRSSREIWPEGDIFGSSNMEPLEESLCLRMIFMANINNTVQKSHVDEDMNEEEEEDSDEEQERHEVQLSEQEFSFKGFIRRFAHIKVIQSYCLIFRNFFTNTDDVNHCILRLFHRIAWDCKLVAIFFQASLFKTFQIILDDPSSSMKCYKDAVNFIKFIFRKFLQVSEENKKVFVELLFWKTNKDALQIECGYDTNESTSGKNAWSEEEEDELRRLYLEFRDETCAGKDLADLIKENLINHNRTRRMIINKMKEMGLISDLKDLRRKTVKVKEAQQWTEEQVVELKSLVEEYKDAIHPIARIMDHMSMKRSKRRVVAKIMELQLVENKKDLQKKRGTEKSKSKNHGENFLRANASDEDDSDDNVEGRETEFIDGESGSEANSDEEVLSGPIKGKSTKSFKSLPIPTPALISSSLSKALDNGWRDAVEWLSELLEETADEREQDGDIEPIPLITVTDICNRAMEDEDFLELLRVVGVQPPRNHQEMFWRIPSNISIDGLRKRGMFLKQRLNGELETENSTTDENIQHENIGEETETKSSDFITFNHSSDEESDNNTLGSYVSKNVLQNVENILDNKKEKKRSLRIDKTEEKQKTTKKRRIIVEDIEDEDTEDTREPDPILNTNQSRIYDSDDEKSSPIIKTKRRQILMSDDESSPVKMTEKSSISLSYDNSPIKASGNSIVSSDDEDATISKSRTFSRLKAIEDSDDD